MVPVGIEAQTYAVEENGLLPWVNEALAELDAEPTILPATVEDPAYEEIAEVLSIPLGTVKIHIFRARAELARRMKALGWDPEGSPGDAKLKQPPSGPVGPTGAGR